MVARRFIVVAERFIVVSRRFIVVGDLMLIFIKSILIPRRLLVRASGGFFSRCWTFLIEKNVFGGRFWYKDEVFRLRDLAKVQEIKILSEM